MFKDGLMESIRSTLHTKANMSSADTYIVDIQFTFWNEEMLKLLKRRANALRKVKFEKVRKIEAKMDELKDRKFEKLRTPNSFYCTFEKTKA